MRKELSEEEQFLAKKFGDELADKTYESLMDPRNKALDEEIKNIRKKIGELGLEIHCSREFSIDVKDPEKTELRVTVTLYYPPTVN